MRFRRQVIGIAAGLAFCVAAVVAQDSVDVTFRYVPPGGVGTVYLTGEFVGWQPTAVPMDYFGTYWAKTRRLRIGGNPNPPSNGVPGAWQYKFYYSGASPWPNDPLNHHQNPRDNNNTFVYTKDPTILYLLPNQRNPLVSTSYPTISAYIYPKVGTTVDTASITLTIDAATYNNLGVYYDAGSKQFSFVPPAPLVNGSHTVILRAGTIAGGTNADTVTFVTQSGFVQITTQGGYPTRNPVRTVRGVVQSGSVTTVKVVRNNTDTTTVPVSGGAFTATDSLVEGLNTFRALADSSGTLVASFPVSFTYLVNHSPHAAISFLDNPPTITLQAIGSTDPDPGQTATLTFLWSEDPSNPSAIGGINGTTSPTVNVARPSVQGEYYFGLIAIDTDGNRDTTRTYFTLGPTPPVAIPTIASVPRWVREGRLYEMFFKAHTPQGTINAAYPDLDRIAAMGYNIIWVMPVMTNAYPIDNGTGPGYNITDLYTVAPEYGTNQDFKDFVARAHQLGMKVILDVTPNHTSSAHPFVLDGKTYGQNSRYWNYYQHQVIPYTGPGLGEFGSAPNHDQSSTPEGYIYYGPFSDALLNYNWGDIDARDYMIGVYKWWVKEMGVDGYRFDVYWGPHIRTSPPNGGETEMGVPTRQALKHIKPDVYLLGEASGVGVGTEVLYADNSIPGGVESAYDWNLKNFINDPTFWSQAASSRVNTLDQRLRNVSAHSGMGFIPGPNSYFMRFLENHDEDRVVYLFSAGTDSVTAIRRTMPVSSSVQLAVGMPMVYAGQEAGRGIGISNYDQRRRGVIQWNTYAAGILGPHYQKLAQIKKQYPAFSTQEMVRVTTNFSGVYAYTRPYAGQNGLIVANLENTPRTVTISLPSGGGPSPLLGITDGVKYYASDLYNATLDSVIFSGGNASLAVNLPALGSAVFVLDTVVRSLQLPPLTGVNEGSGQEVPEGFVLQQNYPNPFNPTTVVRYQLSAVSNVKLVVYDLLGREVAVLVNERKSAGMHEVRFDGAGVSSGVYFYRLTADDGVGGVASIVRKMILIR